MIILLLKFRKLFKRKQKRQLVILFFLMVIGAFLEIMGVSLVVPLVSAIMQKDIMESNKLVGKLCDIFNIQTNQGFLIFCVILLIFVFVFKDLYLIFQMYVQNRFVYNNRFRIQQQLLNAYLNRPYEFYLNINSGEIVRVVQTDVNSTFHLLNNIMSSLSETVVSFTLIIVVFCINPLMTLLVAFILLLTMLAIIKVARPLLKHQGLILKESYAQTNKWLIQIVNGMKEILVGNRKDFFQENFSLHGKRLVCAEQWNNLLGNIPRLLIEMASVCSMLIALLCAVLSGQELSGLVPTIAAFAMAALKLMPSANRISSTLNQIMYYEPALDSLLESLAVLETERKVDIEKENLKNSKLKVLTLKNQIELSSISYTYLGGAEPVLSCANMVIPIGKSVGIIGVSGAGKTTAVDLLLGLLTPQQGEVLADGLSISKYYEEWLSCIGYIPQMIFMLDDTIRANVAFGILPEEIDEKRVWEALEEAQLMEFVKGLSQGLDTTIGERGIRLSGGQRQRIGIARALYTNPSVLFFDEATSALDQETETAIMESINRLHGKKTLVIIAHRLGTIAECDLVYRVENGKIRRER